MDKSPELYNRLVGSVKAPRPILGETLVSETVVETRDTFFNAIRKSLEQSEISPGMLDAALKVHRLILPAIQEGNTDITDELSISKIPLAFALQTRENAQDIVRFGTFPVNNLGHRAFAALEQADGMASMITFRR